MIFNALNYYSPAISALSGVAVAIFTIALAVSTRALWVETKRLAVGAEGQSADFRRSLDIAQSHADSARASVSGGRAWMCYEQIAINPMTGGTVSGHPFRIGTALSVIWTNKGHSPALDVEIYATVCFATEKNIIAPVFDYEFTQPYVGTPIGPNASAKSAMQFMLDETLASFEERKIVVYLYSSIKYKDIFFPEIARLSECCFRISYTGTQLTPEGETIPLLDIKAVGRQNTVR